MSWADTFWNGGSASTGALGDPTRFSLTGPAMPLPPSDYGMSPTLNLGSTVQASGAPMRPLPQATDEQWAQARNDKATADAEAKRKSRENTQAFGQMIVGLAQAGAQAYAASKQKDLRDRMFQIVYSSGGGGGGVHIPDPLADGIPRVG